MFISFVARYSSGVNANGNTELPIDDFNGIQDIRDAEQIIIEEFERQNVYNIEAIVITGWKRFGT